MPNIRAARSVLPQFKPHTERSVLGGAKVVRCGAVCSGRARQMSLGPAPSLLVSSLGGCSHPPTSVQRIKSNPLTLAPGRSGSAALPSSAPFESSDPHSSLRARLPYRSATRPLHFQVTHPSSPPHTLPPPPLLLFASPTTAHLHLYVARCPRKGAWRFGPSFRSRCFVRSLHV